jgi:HAD superfamily hydrolase (TIGR01549 family)
MSGYNPRKLQSRYFEALEKIHPSSALEPNSSYQGLLVPQLINDNMRGEVSNAEAIRIVRDGIGSLGLSSIERTLLLAINELTFSPRSIAHILTPLDGIKLLHEFVEYRKIYRHLKIILVSNFESESFKAVREKNRRVFDLFDGLEISGDLHLLKPHPTIFQYVLDKYKLRPECCLYFDDAPENIAAAVAMGIKGIQWTNLRDVNMKLLSMGLPACLAMPEIVNVPVPPLEPIAPPEPAPQEETPAQVPELELMDSAPSVTSATAALEMGGPQNSF